MARYLITGAAGFIGSNLTDRLLSIGADVTGVDNFNDFYSPQIKERNLRRALNHPQFQLIRGDLNDGALLANIFQKEKYDAVIHLAARGGVRPSLLQPELYCRDNIAATVSLLEEMRKSETKRLIFASSSSVYGNRTETLFSEDLDVTHPISPYAATKSACEQLCYTWFKIYGIHTVALRFFTVYGRRQRPDLAIAKFCEKILHSEPIPFYGDGSTIRDYTYIDDILDGILGAIQYSATPFEVVNLGGGEPVSLKRMVEEIEAALQKKGIIQFLPPQPGDVSRTSADIQKARRLFGYLPQTNFTQGIRAYADWLRHPDEIE